MRQSGAGQIRAHLRKPDKTLKFLEGLFGGIMVLIWDYTQPEGRVRYGDLDFCVNCAKQFEEKILNFFRKP